MVTDPPTHKQTGPITIHCAAPSAQCNKNREKERERGERNDRQREGSIVCFAIFSVVTYVSAAQLPPIAPRQSYRTTIYRDVHVDPMIDVNAILAIAGATEPILMVYCEPLWHEQNESNVFTVGVDPAEAAYNVQSDAQPSPLYTRRCVWRLVISAFV